MITLESIEKRVRDSAELADRLEECKRRVGNICATGKQPKMSIPVEWYDDDIFIITTLKDAIIALNAK